MKAYLLLTFAAVFTFNLTLTGEEKQKKEEEVVWKTYSKNKSYIFVDHTVNTGSNEDTFGVYKSENLMEGTYRNYTAGARKTLLIFTRKEPDDSIRDFDYKYSNETFNHSFEHWVDRLYFKGKWKPVQFTLGDFYESMNRGMAFSMKNDPVYGDNSIRGINITSSFKGFRLKAFGGRANPQIRDDSTFERMKEADDWLAGMEAGYSFKKVEFGVQYGYGNYGKYELVSPGAGTLKTTIEAAKEFHFTGAYIYLKNPFPRFTWYTGAVYVPYNHEDTFTTMQLGERDPSHKKERTDQDNGSALYSNALYYFDFGKKKSRLTFKVEGKMYNKFFMNYSRMESPDYKRRYFNPPTLLPKELQIDNEFDTWAVGGKIAFNENYSGSKYFIEFTKGDSLNNRDAFPSPKSDIIASYYEEDFWYLGGGGEKSWKNFSVSAGVRYHSAKGMDDDPELKNSRNWIMSHLHMGGHVSKFSVKFTNDYYNKDMFINGTHEMDHAHELKTVLDISWNRKYFLAVKNTLWKNSIEGDNETKWYPGGSLGYSHDPFRIYIFGGLEKGGYTCEGGACRFLPDFKGVKLEVDITL